MWHALDQRACVAFVKLVPIPAALACINTYAMIVALQATAHMGILLKTLTIGTHCQQGLYPHTCNISDPHLLQTTWVCICTDALCHWIQHVHKATGSGSNSVLDLLRWLQCIVLLLPHLHRCKDHSIPTHSGYQHVIELYSLHILNAPTLGIHIEKASTTHKVIDPEPAGISCSWAWMPSSSVVLHWHMHMEPQQSWLFGSFLPLLLLHLVK
jgi:hypothetical protein